MKMRKKILSLFIALTMLMSFIGAMPITASAEPPHTHKVCEGAECTDPNHESHTDITWTAWTSDNSIPTEAGNYYLTTNVTLENYEWISSETKICLNGHTITQNGNNYALQVKASGRLDLCDCSEGQTGKITAGAENKKSLVYIAGPFNLYSGAITGGHAEANGAGVNGYGLFNMYGGKITGNSTTKEGGGVYTTGTFNMYGGEISGNTAKSGGGVSASKFNMYGGKISDNTATEYGGGLIAPTSNLYRGEISGNNANSGGGVSIRTLNASFNMYEGVAISGNTATGPGGGIYLYWGNLKMYGGEISGNSANSGGGVHISYSNYTTITVGGTVSIKDNTKNNNIPNNAYMYGSGIISVDSDTPLTDSAEIGVTYSNSIIMTSVNITGENAADYSKYFKSDSEDYIIKNTDNIVQLADPAIDLEPHTHKVCEGAECTDPNHESHTDITWTAWTKGSSLPTATGNYYLTKDVTLTEGTSGFASNIKLCLNGYTVKRTVSYSPTMSINAGGSLDLCDCKGGGALTTPGNNPIVSCKGTFNMYGGALSGQTNISSWGGGVAISESGIFNMYAGEISGNKVFRGGGVIINENSENGVFNMYGGEIKNNEVNQDGGGVAVLNGTFNMLGGKISGNKTAQTGSSASFCGGGVHAAADAKSVVIKGEISGNSANYGGGVMVKNSNTKIIDAKITGNTAIFGGGVSMYWDGTPLVTLGGSTTILGNTKESPGTVNNLHISAQGTVAIDTDTPLADGAEIGVSYSLGAPVNITGTNAADYSAYFKSDNENYEIVNNENNIVQLVTHTHEWGNWSITTEPTTEATGIAERICTKNSSHKDTFTLPVLTDTSVWTEGDYTAPTEDADGSQEYTSDYGNVTVVLPATGHTHTWGDWTITANPTTEATGTAERVCTKNGDHKDTKALPVLTDTTVWTVGTKVEPTEDADGSQEYTSDYGIVTVTIPATGHTHTWGAWTITANPTMEATGTAERVCTKNGEHKDTYTLPVLTDTSVWTEGDYTAPTEDADGSQEYTSEYGKVTVTIPATGHTHTWGDWSIKTEPTTQATGTAERVCTKNGEHKDTYTLPALTDTTVWTVGTKVEPTETTDGSQEYTSDYGIVTVIIPATGQSQKTDSEVVIKDNTPNVTVDGLDELAKIIEPTAKNVTITMTVESKAEDSENTEQNAIKTISASVKIDYLDISLIKTVDSVESSISETARTLTIIIPFDMTGKKNIKVYRYHIGSAELLSDNAANDEYYVVGDGIVTVYANKFSTYAIGYDTENVEPSPTPTTKPSHGSSSISSYKVTFKAGENGKITKGNASVSVSRNSKIKDTQIPVITANEGYTFIGWSTDGKTTVEPTAAAITKATTFTALYEAETVEPTIEPTGEPTTTPEAKQHKAYIVGYEGKFIPDGNITRAETAAILARLTDGFEETESYRASFADVDNALWYYRYIGFEENQNIITGYQDGTFKPEESITRAEFASMITRFASLSTANADMPFTDTDGHWASEQIAACYEAGYIKGYKDNTFLPDNYITRAEAVAIINRVTGRNDIKDFENPFTDVSNSHWAYADIMEAAVTHNVE